MKRRKEKQIGKNRRGEKREKRKYRKRRERRKGSGKRREKMRGKRRMRRVKSRRGTRKETQICKKLFFSLKHFLNPSNKGSLQFPSVFVAPIKKNMTIRKNIFLTQLLLF